VAIIASEIASLPAFIVAALMVPECLGMTIDEGALFGLMLETVSYGCRTADCRNLDVRVAFEGGERHA
jgi:hypothetical protein